MKYFVLLVCVGVVLTSCVKMDIMMTPDDNKFLRDKKGYIVTNCSNDILFKNVPDTQYFWEKNNLPKGTTEFICVDGKAYLKGKEPNK